MSGIPQGSVRGPLLFLIYINDLPDGINSLCKIFADDASLFSKVSDIRKSASNLNDDLEKISYWVYQWKMQFNLDPNKQANEVIFSRKTSSNNLSHPPIKFNNNNISKCPHQKHLGIVLDSKLNFNAHVDPKIKKCNRIIGLLDGSQSIFLEVFYVQYKSFVRFHLDYGDILYDKPNNENFRNKLEKVRYRACLAITGAIQGTSKTKLYDELGLHSLIRGLWCNKLIFFYKIVNGLLSLFTFGFPLSNKLFLKIRISLSY